MGWPKAIHLGNKTSVLDNMLAVSATREESVNIGLYKDETGGALSPSAKKRVMYQRKTWSIAECNELRKRRDEGQGFSGLATHFGVSVSAVTQRYCKIISDERDCMNVDLSDSESDPESRLLMTRARKEGAAEENHAQKVSATALKSRKFLTLDKDVQADESSANRMESNSHQAVDASHACPNGHQARSSVSLEPRPEPMVILSRSVSATTDGESRKRRRLADGGGSQDELEGGYQDAHMALAVRVADLQAKVLNVTNDYKQLKDINSALEIKVAKLKVRAVKPTECNFAQLRDISFDTLDTNIAILKARAVEDLSKRREPTERHAALLEDINFTLDTDIAKLKARAIEDHSKLCESTECHVEQLKDINSALETDIAELKAQAVKGLSKLREQTECHIAQLKDLDKQHAKEVTDLKTQHSARVKELEDQIVKYKRVIAAWNA